MDKLDRMLHALPREAVPDTLARSIAATVHHRHRRVRAVRQVSAALIAALGVWLVWPGIAWMTSNELFVSGAPWLTGGLEYLDYETAEALNRLWNGAIAMQGAIGSTLGVSILLGVLFLCCSIFLAIEPASWRPIPGPSAAAGRTTILASGLHS